MSVQIKTWRVYKLCLLHIGRKKHFLIFTYGVVHNLLVNFETN